MTSYLYICGILLTIISLIVFLKEVFDILGGENTGLKVFKLLVSISASWLIPVMVLGGMMAIFEIYTPDISGFVLWIIRYPMVIICFIGLEMLLYNKLEED